MKEITYIKPMSLAVVSGVMHAALGLIVGLALLVPVLLGLSLGAPMPGTQASGPLLLVVALSLAAAVLYGVLGFLMGLLGAWVYNLVASRIGGVKVVLVEQTAPATL